MKPLHPIVVHFPIALLPLSVAADLVGFFANIPSLSQTGWWTLLGAAGGAVVTVAAGLFDMSRATLSEEVHHRVHRHMYIGLVLLTIIIGLTIWRGMIFANGWVVPMLYLDLAVLAVALVALQGWLGGELVYSDGVFVQQGNQKLAKDKAASGKTPPAAAKTKASGHQGH